MRRCLLLLASLTLLVGFHVTPASVSSGKMKVTVKDAEGAPLRGAQVTAETVESLTKRSGNTDEAGAVTLLSLDPSAKYVVTTFFPGYNTGRNENVPVHTGTTTHLVVELVPGLTETVLVRAQRPLVDVTTATAQHELDLDLLESFPNSTRGWQSGLQLVPGVGPASMPGFGNDPPSRSGINMNEWGSGGWGDSTDNVYYLEGINVTSNGFGTSTAHLNTEAIHKQSVITGGAPAEYKGAPGLISNVVTKTGTNHFTGSANFFLQHDGLMENDRRSGFLKQNDFRSYDTAITLGAPIKRDKAWLFVSYRKDDRKDFVLNADPVGGFTRTVEENADQYYAKITWQITGKDRLSGTLMMDLSTDTGSADANVVNGRLQYVDRGSTRYIANYQRFFGSGVLELSVAEHPDEYHGKPILPETFNNILFDMQQDFTISDQQLGGSGWMEDWKDTNQLYKGSIEWLVQSSWGHHTIKGGFAIENLDSNNKSGWIGGAYSSLNNDLPGFLAPIDEVLSADYIASGNLTESFFDPWDPTHFNGLLTSIDASPNSDAHRTVLDTHDCATDPTTCTAGPDGMISQWEVANNIVFDNTAGNPHGAINYVRFAQSEPDVWESGAEGLSLYLQDTLQRGRWTFNAGVRAETWEHFDSAGKTIMDFDWVVAPRVSAIVDVKGDGKQKLSGFYGRYYDPIRLNLSSWVGTPQLPQRQWQLFVNGEWLAWWRSGGPNQLLGLFSPATKTPYTDEWQIGYEIDLGRNMSLATNFIKRKTRDLSEDYRIQDYVAWDPNDPASPYYDPSDPDPVFTTYPGCWTDPQVGWIGSAACNEVIAHPESLFLGLDYFGLSSLPARSYVIAPLAGGYRDYEGFEVIFRKRRSNRWQAMASYAYGDAHGNTNSDSSAGLQADYLQFDPRAPNSTGRIPGTIKHQFKVLGSYAWDNGFKLGATYRWYSGMYDHKRYTWSMPVLTGYPGSTMPPYEYAGFEYEWIEYGAVGGFRSSPWDVMDVRAQYNHKFGSVATEFFVDVLSVFNSQKGVRRLPLVGGAPWLGLEYGENLKFAPPRRYYLGTRVSF